MSDPLAVILCKFLDDSSEPQQRKWYEMLFTHVGAGTDNLPNTSGTFHMVTSRSITPKFSDGIPSTRRFPITPGQVRTRRVAIS